MSWTERYFGSDYPRLYPGHLDPGVAAREALASVRSLGLRPPARILDLACGFGRHALALAEAGYEVVGVDLSAPLLELAATRAREAGVGAGLRFLRADYREVRARDLGGPVDGALCLFHSLGYGEEADDDRALASVLDCLRPGGRFLLDLGNHPRMMEADGRQAWSEHGEGEAPWFVLERFAFDRITRRLEGERVLVEPTIGRVLRFPFAFRSFTLPELRGRVRDAGFKLLSAYGSLDRAPYDASSPRLVLLCEKP